MEVRREMHDGVYVGGPLGDEDTVTFEEAVTLMKRKDELIMIGSESHWMPASDFPEFTKFGIIRKGKLTQTEKGEETGDKHGDEQQVVVRNGCLAICRDDCV
jgi:hypothetical protein